MAIRDNRSTIRFYVKGKDGVALLAGIGRPTWTRYDSVGPDVDAVIEIEVEQINEYDNALISESFHGTPVEVAVHRSLDALHRRQAVQAAADKQRSLRNIYDAAKGMLFGSLYGGVGDQKDALEQWRKARSAWRGHSAFVGYEKVVTAAGRYRTISYFDLEENW